MKSDPQKNKDRYENDVREPLLKFIEAFAPQLQKMGPHFVAESAPRCLSITFQLRDSTPENE